MPLKHTMRLLATCSMAAFSTTAFAQSASTSTDSVAMAEADQGSDIIVTAQKREEKLRDVPASISVLSGDRMERTGTTSLADYASYIPGFTVNNGGAPGKTSIILRGISTGSGGALVGTYLDDTPLGSSSGFARGGSFQLDLLPYDLDRLEVLRGPQGTLYGAGAMGGLLKYVLREADPNKVEVRAGAVLESTASTSRPTWGLRGAVNVPIVEGTLAVRVSGFYQDNAGWIDNVGRGIKNENNSTQQGGRAALFWEPSSNLKITATAMFQDIKADGNAVVQLDPKTLQPLYGMYGRSTKLAEPYSQKLRFYSLTGNWDIGFASITSATSWSRSKNRSIVDESPIYSAYFKRFDPTAPANGLSDFNLNVSLNKFTQEVRMASSGHSRFEWMLGGFYTNENVLNLQTVGAYDQFGVPIASLNPIASVYWPTTYREYAAFGNVTYKFSEMFDITGGVRYSHNKQNYYQDVNGPLVGGPGHSTAVSSDNVTTWSVSTRFRPTTSSTFYLRAASGYRPGGPNVALPGVPPSYKADRLINYEAGYKATLLNGALDLDLAAFYIDWSDIQIGIIRDGVSFPGNGSKASSRGFEASGQYKLNRYLRIGANAAYTKARLDEAVPTLRGLKGDQLPGSPHWTASTTIDYSAPLANGSTLSAGAAYRYRGTSLTALQSAPGSLPIPPQNVVDVYAGLGFGAATARLYARNLFNNRSYTTYFDPDAGKSANFVPIQPRTIGISLDTRF